MNFRAISARLTSGVLAAAVLAGLGLAAPRAAHARGSGGEKTWRMATYGLGAATVYGAVTKNPAVAVLGGVGTYLTYKKWKDAEKRRHHDEGRYGRDYYDDRYRGGDDRYRGGDDRYGNTHYHLDDQYRNDARYNNDSRYDDRYTGGVYDQRRYEDRYNISPSRGDNCRNRRDR